MLLVLCSTFSFGQYIKEAIITLKKDEKSSNVKDVIFHEETIEYKDIYDPFTQLVALKNDIDITFDSVHFSKIVPVLKETYLQNQLEDGIYETYEDFLSNKPTSKEKIEGKEDGKDVFNYANDLMLFKYVDKKQLVKNPFAIVYKGDLYFSLKRIKELESKDMKITFPIVMNRYIRMRYENDGYYYSEFFKKNRTGDGSLGAGFGAIGAVLSVALTSKVEPGESIPFLFMKSENTFYQLDNCLKFNDFLEPKLGIKLLCYEKKDLDSKLLRKLLMTNL